MELERLDEVVRERFESDAENTEVEPDLPPEYTRYRDEGCELASSCLHCPFPRCLYDEYGGKRRWLKKRRAKEMARLFTTEGKRVKELATMFDVSQRTVQRALKTALGDSGGDKRDE